MTDKPAEWPRDSRGRFIPVAAMTHEQRLMVSNLMAASKMHFTVGGPDATELEDENLVNLTDHDRQMIRELLAEAEFLAARERGEIEYYDRDDPDPMIVHYGIWTAIRASPFLTLAFTLIILGTILLILASCGGERVPTVRATEPCAMSVSDAQAEDDICTTWLDEDGNVVFGPLWAKP